MSMGPSHQPLRPAICSGWLYPTETRDMVHTARADGLLKAVRTDEPRARIPFPAPAEAADGECICGLIRYDD